MKQYAVVLTPEAEEQLAELYRYIAEKAPDVTALRYTTAIVDYCENLKVFPHRGTKRVIFVPDCVLQTSGKMPWLRSA